MIKLYYVRITQCSEHPLGSRVEKYAYVEKYINFVEQIMCNYKKAAPEFDKSKSKRFISVVIQNVFGGFSYKILDEKYFTDITHSMWRFYNDLDVNND